MTTAADREGSLASAPEPIVEVSGLGLRFSGLTVLDDISFSVDPGDVLGIVGANGAGKTSLLNCLSGVYRPTSGSIRIFGRRTQALAPHRIARIGVARTFQNVDSFRDMRVIDLVLLGRHIRMQSNMASYLIGKPLWDGSERAHRRAAMEALDFVGLSRAAHAEVADLPYGALKLVDLARTLAAEAPLVLLDEPTSGLSHAERGEVATILERIRSEYRTTQILIEHDVALAKRVCGKLLALSGGVQIAFGRPQDVLGHPEVVRSFLGPGARDSGERARVPGGDDA